MNSIRTYTSRRRRHFSHSSIEVIRVLVIIVFVRLVLLLLRWRSASLLSVRAPEVDVEVHFRVQHKHAAKHGPLRPK